MAIKAISMDIQANESINKAYSKALKMPLDIPAILIVIGRNQNSLNDGDSNCLNL